MQAVHGACWSHTGTVGNIALAHDRLHGDFPSREGGDAIVACDLIPAGKYRNGAARAWCRTHQIYWGVKADIAALAQTGQRRCARHAEPMAYALDVPLIDLAHHPGLSVSAAQPGRVVAIDVAGAGLFDAPDIVRVHLTPPAVQAYVAARRSGLPLGCVSCARCRHPHLDLGDFAANIHRRHYCGNCGNDGTHSATSIVSSPLHVLSAAFGPKLSFV